MEIILIVLLFTLHFALMLGAYVLGYFNGRLDQIKLELKFLETVLRKKRKR